MQTQYEHSEHQQNHSEDLTPVHSVATSELSPAVQTGSKVALVLVLLITALSSLKIDPNATTSQTEESESIESVATTPIEESPIVTEPLSSTTSQTETTSPTTTATDSTSETTAVDVTQPETTTTTTDTTNSEISTLSQTPETAEVTSTPTDPTASKPVEDTVAVTTPAAIPDTAASTAETQTASRTISATEIDKLNQILYNKIDKTWTVPVNGESVYKVQVTQDGSIIGYEPKSQVSTNNANNTPLPSLVQSSDSSATSAQEPYAEFEVIFTPSGVLEVKN